MSGFDATAYGRDIADIYDELYQPGADAPAAAAALGAAAPDSPVLELGVGTGRMALPLRDAGLDVHGLEISPEMIAGLAERDPDGTITVHEGDMTAFDLCQDFGAVVIFSDGLYALPTQDQQIRCLQCCARHLRPGASLFVETTWPGEVQKSASGLPAAVKHRADNSLMITTAYHKPLSQVSLYVHSLLGNGPARSIKELFRSIWPSELDLMARLAGMTLQARWQDWSGTPVSETPTRIISVYRLTAESAT